MIVDALSTLYLFRERKPARGYRFLAGIESASAVFLEMRQDGRPIPLPNVRMCLIVSRRKQRVLFAAARNLRTLRLRLDRHGFRAMIISAESVQDGYACDVKLRVVELEKNVVRRKR